MASNPDSIAPYEGVAGSSVLPGPTVPSVSRRPRQRGRVIRLFTSVFLSLYGDWLTTVALVVVLFELTGSPAGPAGYILARVAPRVVGPSIGGRLSDRWSPRLVMVSASLIQAAMIALLIVAHRDQALWGIYASVAVSQFVGAVARPSQGAMLPRLVSDAALPRANATYALFFSSSIFVAPAIGAALLTRVGPDTLFALDGFSFLVSAVLAASLPSGAARERHDATAPAERPAPFQLRTVLRDPVIRLVAVANFTTTAAVTVVQAFLVVAAHERFGSDTAVGYLYAAVGVGGTIGGLIGLRWMPPQRRMAGGLAMASLVALLALGGFGAPTGGVFAVTLLAVSALGTASIDVWGFTQVQRRAPPEHLGRYTSITWMAMYTGMLAGAVAALGLGAFVAWDRVIEATCLLMVGVVGISWASLPLPGALTPPRGWVDFAEERRRQAQAEENPEKGVPSQG